MGALTSVTNLGYEQGGPGRMKKAYFSALLPASYDASGSVVDLSSATLGSEYGFACVHGAVCTGISPVGSHKYVVQYLRASAGAAATGKFTVYDHTLHPGAEVTAATDLHATTVYFEVTGY